MKQHSLSALVLALALIGCGNNIAANNTPSQPAPTQPTTPNESSDSPKTQEPATIIPSPYSDIQTALQANLAKSGIQVTINDVAPSGMPDIYMVSLASASPVFTDKTGTYIIQGDIIELGQSEPVNISAKAHSIINKQILSDIPASQMIIYPAKAETKAFIYVFSDPTCHYCQLLHQDVPKLNSKGIEVRYLAWPRSEQSIPLTKSIWCSSDPHQALTDAKLGKTLPPASCDNPVRNHMQIGLSLGVSGTPAIFTQSGEQIGGYLPVNDMVKAAIAGK